jgi:hypothetical protein
MCAVEPELCAICGKLPAKDPDEDEDASRPCARGARCPPDTGAEPGAADGDPKASEEDPEDTWEDPEADPVGESTWKSVLLLFYPDCGKESNELLGALF